MLAVIALLATLVASNGGEEALTGQMAMYNNLLNGPWTCTMGSATYKAWYHASAGNTLHGNLWSNDSSEDEYAGYDAQRKVYWLASADTTGATESQTSADGVTYDGTINDGTKSSKATNIYTIDSAHKFTVQARGSMGGKPYDVTVTCTR